jgi:G3E family GTPase
MYFARSQGFLGSGKTTLLNYILKANHGKKIAVIENGVSTHDRTLTSTLCKIRRSDKVHAK